MNIQSLLSVLSLRDTPKEGYDERKGPVLLSAIELLRPVPKKSSRGALGILNLAETIISAGRFVATAAVTVMTATMNVAMMSVKLVARVALQALRFFIFTPIGQAIAAGAAIGFGAYHVYRKIKEAAGREEPEVTEAEEAEPSTTLVVPKTQGPVPAGRAREAKALLAKRTASAKDAIEEASRRVGVPEHILTSFAAKESSFREEVKAHTGSAKGLFQFLRGTWKDMLAKYGPRYGVPKNASRGNPLYSALMAAAYLKHEIYPSISKAVGSPNATDLYLGHMMGPTGGANFLRKLSSSPNRIAALDMPREAKANDSVYYIKDPKTKRIIRARTYQEIYDFFHSFFQSLEVALLDEAGDSVNLESPKVVMKPEPKKTLAQESQGVEPSTPAPKDRSRVTSTEVDYYKPKQMPALALRG